MGLTDGSPCIALRWCTLGKSSRKGKTVANFRAFLPRFSRKSCKKFFLRDLRILSAPTRVGLPQPDFLELISCDRIPATICRWGCRAWMKNFPGSDRKRESWGNSLGRVFSKGPTPITHSGLSISIIATRCLSQAFSSGPRTTAGNLSGVRLAAVSAMNASGQ